MKYKEIMEVSFKNTIHSRKSEFAKIRKSEFEKSGNPSLQKFGNPSVLHGKSGNPRCENLSSLEIPKNLRSEKPGFKNPTRVSAKVDYDVCKVYLST